MPATAPDAVAPWRALLHGARDALRVSDAIYCWKSSEKLRQRIYDSLKLNLVLFLGSLLLYRYALMPAVAAVFAAIASAETNITVAETLLGGLY